MIMFLLLAFWAAQRCFPSAEPGVKSAYSVTICFFVLRRGQGGSGGNTGLARQQGIVNSCRTSSQQPYIHVLSMSHSRLLDIKIKQSGSNPVIPKPTSPFHSVSSMEEITHLDHPEHPNKMCVFFIKPLISSGS